jgi:CheY-like chemotaxis protein
MQLEAAGFAVRQAEDGIDGLAKLRDKLPKVIISDLEMPRMSGIEFISVVRQRFPSIQVIALSGSNPNEFPAEAQPDVWLAKGTLKFSELLQTLRDLVRKTPDRANVPPMVTTPARVRPGVAGYFILTCANCLRTFRAMATPKDKTVEGAARCSHCEAWVPFLMERVETA